MTGRYAAHGTLLLAFTVAMGCGGKSELKNGIPSDEKNLAGAAGAYFGAGATSLSPPSTQNAGAAGHAGMSSNAGMNASAAGAGAGTAGASTVTGSGAMAGNHSLAMAGNAPVASAGVGNGNVSVSTGGAAGSVAASGAPSTGGIATGGLGNIGCGTVGLMRCENNLRLRCETNGNWALMAQRDQCGGGTPVCSDDGICAAYRLVTGSITGFAVEPASSSVQRYVLTQQTLLDFARVCSDKFCVTGGIRP